MNKYGGTGGLYVEGSCSSCGFYRESKGMVECCIDLRV